MRLTGCAWLNMQPFETVFQLKLIYQEREAEKRYERQEEKVSKQPASEPTANTEGSNL